MRLNKHILGFCTVVLLVMSGCKCNKNKEVKVDDTYRLSLEDSLQILQSFRENDGKNILNTHSQQWIVNKLQNNHIDWKSFNMESVREVENPKKKVTFTPSDSFYYKYDSVLSWSLDSNYIVDFGSYGTMPVKGKDGKVHLEGSDPDSKVSLIDVKNKLQTQILYAGPSTSIIGVKWINDTEALMLFAQTDNVNKSDTLMWLIDVHKNQIRQYKYH